MNIDARLEALTQTVELLASLHRDNEKAMAAMQHDAEKRMERLDLHMREFTEQIKTLGKRNLRLETLVTDIAEGTARLLRTVEAHEHRIGDLEENRHQ
jgi:hypothetical protein